MTNRYSQCTVALLTTVMLGACSPEVEVSINPEVLKAMREMAAAQGKLGDFQLDKKKCTVFLVIDESTDGHLVVGQKIRMHGPINTVGDYKVRPIGSSGGVPPHPWKDGNYDAYTVTTSGKDFKSNIPVTASPHTEDPHLYDITIVEFAENGCPHEVKFETKYDVDAKGDDHGGHSTGRD